MIKVLASGSKGNCYYIDSETPLLLEAGIPLKDIQRRLDYSLVGVGACLVSHEHKDHCKSVADLMKRGIDCYMTKGTADALGLVGHRLHIIKTREQFKVNEWTILPFDTQHDAAEPVGFLLSNCAEKILFVTDSFYCKYRFSGCTYIAVECNYAADILAKNIAAGTIPIAMQKRLEKSHFSLENVKEFLKACDLSQCREIMLIHLSDGNSNAERFKREIQELTSLPVSVW